MQVLSSYVVHVNQGILILIQIRKQVLSSSKVVCKRDPAFDFKLNSIIAEYVIRVNQLRS